MADTVELTLPEYISAVQVGIVRFTISEAARLNAATTYPRTWYQRLQEEIIGACGERAWCKYRNQHWDASFNTFHRVADAAGGVEVRSTTRDDGCLIIRHNDDADRWYVLIVGEPPLLRVAGYIKGEDAKIAEWVRDPHRQRPAWFVPQSALKPYPWRC